jgi:hypothetical protein
LAASPIIGPGRGNWPHATDALPGKSLHVACSNAMPTWIFTSACIAITAELS